MLGFDKYLAQAIKAYDMMGDEPFKKKAFDKAFDEDYDAHHEDCRKTWATKLDEEKGYFVPLYSDEELAPIYERVRSWFSPLTLNMLRNAKLVDIVEQVHFDKVIPESYWEEEHTIDVYYNVFKFNAEKMALVKQLFAMD